jgi:hypothetical protein
MYLNKNVICLTVTTSIAFFVARSLYKWQCPFLVKKNKENEENEEEHVEVYYEASDTKPEESEDAPPENYPLPPVPQFSIKPQLSVPSGLYFEFGNVNQTNQ